MDADALKLAIESLEGDFELVRELGRGATAVVYLLRDRGLDRDVALKVMRGGVGTDEEAVARLQREAHLVAQLQHPNIVKLYGTQRISDGSFALLMEHVPGRNLKEILIKEGALPIPRVLEILKDVASALAYAHRRRIVHRDVKPENIYIDEEVGAARLADFGVARPWDQDSRLTIPGASLGTPAYMSPEQIDGKEVDGRSDVYSLGLVGYEIILGQHPWEGENLFSTIFKQKNESLPMEVLGLERYPALSEILETALQKDPQSRWESADAFLKELQAVVPLRRRDDPDVLEPLAERERPRGARRGDAPPNGQGAIHWDGINWVDLGREEPRPVDWPDFPGAPDGARVAEPQNALDRSAPLPAPVDPHTLAIQKKRMPRVAPWLVLAVVLVTGSYGAYRWFLNPGAGSGTDTLLLSPGVPNPQDLSALPTTTGRSPTGSSLLVLTGGNAQGPVGSSTTLVTRASAADGTPLGDTLVLFEVVEGEGTLEAEAVRTGASGLAEVALRLPTRAGDVVVRATLAGSRELEARFQVSALPGPPREITTIVGNGQTALPGGILPEFVGVRVVDEFRNPVPNASVRFRVVNGGGQVQPSEAFTDDVGRAFARWTLGSSLGPQALAAVVPEAGDSLLTFQAMAEEASTEPVANPEPAGPTTPSAPLPARVLSRPFAIGGSSVCSLMGGTALCRGGTDAGQGGGGSVAGLRALAAGVSHSCGLQEDGAAWCWGANESGQLGDGSTADKQSAVAVVTETPFSLLVAGLSHTCGLDGRGLASCWGRGLNGQLGDGSRTDRTRPTPVSGALSLENMSAGWNHTCALTSSGRAYCWGLNGDGQLGDGSRVDRLVPTRVPGTFNALAAGAGHTCGISGNTLLCWGDNGSGQLGDGSTAGRLAPAPVLGLPSPPSALVAGAVHTCALLTDGAAYCWGQNLHGQLGNGSTENSPLPEPVAGGLRFVTLYAGGGVTCGFLRDGSEYCWGMNQGGQLGDGTRTNRSSPVRVGGELP